MPQGNPEIGLQNGAHPSPASRGSMAAAAAAATSISRTPSMTRHSNDISKPLSSSPSKTVPSHDSTPSFAAKAAAAGMQLKRSATTTSLPPQHIETRRQPSTIDKTPQQPQKPNGLLISSLRSQGAPGGSTIIRPEHPTRGRVHPNDAGPESGVIDNTPSLAASAAHRSLLQARLSSPPSVPGSTPASPPSDMGKFRTAGSFISSAAGAATSSVSLPILMSDDESVRDINSHPQDPMQFHTDKHVLHPSSANAAAAASKTLSKDPRLQSPSPARERFGNPGAKAAAAAANKLQESMKAQRDYRDAVYHEEMKAKQMDALLKTNGVPVGHGVDHHQPEPIFASSLRPKTRSPASSIHSCDELSLGEKSSSSQESQPEVLHTVSAPPPQVILPGPRALQHHSLRTPSVKRNVVQNVLRKSHDTANLEKERIRTINQVEDREAAHSPLFAPLPRREVTKDELLAMGMPSKRDSSEIVSGVPNEQSSSVSAAQRSWQAIHNNPFESDKLDDPSLPIPRTITGNTGRLFALVGKSRVRNPQPYHHANRHRASDDEEEAKKRRHIHLLPRRRRRSSLASKGSRNMRLILSLGDDTEAVDGDASSDEYAESPVRPVFKATRHTTDRPPVFKTTMRKQEKKTFNADKPWKHHAIGPGVTDEERKRYEGIWAANRGLYFDLDPQFNSVLRKEVAIQEKKHDDHDDDKKQDENGTDQSKPNSSPIKTSMDGSTISEPLYDDGFEEDSSDTSSIVSSDTNSDLGSEKDYPENEPRHESDVLSDGSSRKQAHFDEGNHLFLDLEKHQDKSAPLRHVKVSDPVQSASAVSLAPPDSHNSLENDVNKKNWASETNIPALKSTEAAPGEGRNLANRAKEISEAAYEAGREQVSEMKGEPVPFPGPGKESLEGIQKYSECVHPLVVRSIWRRSRLGDGVLRRIWDLVDRKHKGYLTREEFILGMWFVDQCLYGRKLPSRVDARAWSSVGRLAGVKIKDLNELRKKNQTKKALRKAEIRQIKDLKKKNKSKKTVHEAAASEA